MASTSFSTGTTIAAAWLNDVNNLIYNGVISFAQLKMPDGTVGAPAYSFANEAGLGWFRTAGTMNLAQGGTTLMNFSSTALNINGGTPLSFASDTFLYRDSAANTLAQRNGVNSQTLRIYNTFTDASNFERLSIRFSGNIAQILQDNGGTGTARELQIGTTGASALSLIQNGSTRWQVNTNGHLMAPTDNTLDIGASGATRPRTVYVGTSMVIAGQAYTANGAIASITYVFDGGGVALTTGVKGDLLIPFACTINSATLQADQSGSIVVDIWKKTYTLDSPPTVANTITASALPTLASHQSAQDTTLTGWTTSIAANDMLRFNINSITTCTRVTLTLKVTKT